MLAATTTPSATESKNSLSTTTTTTTSRADFLRLWQAGALLAAAAIVGTGASGASAATGAATRLGDEQNASNGCLKFGLYELFKDVFSAIMGEDVAYLYRGLIYLGGAASAEFFADVALCPLEMVKVKIQTSPLGSFPTALAPALSKMRDNSTTTKFPFGSLVPLWSRQIPYTMTKFYFFEKIVELLYATVLTNPRSSYDMDVQLAVTFASGYLAGVICAVVSHPADVIVSKMGEGGKSSVQILSELGLNGVWGGLGTRMFVIGTLTGLQWWIYDIFKAFLGLGTTGG